MLYYVRVPIDHKTYGPHSRSSAMQFARIASQHGSPREVWFRRPNSRGSYLVRVYDGGKPSYRGD